MNLYRQYRSYEPAEEGSGIHVLFQYSGAENWLTKAIENEFNDPDAIVPTTVEMSRVDQGDLLQVHLPYRAIAKFESGLERYQESRKRQKS